MDQNKPEMVKIEQKATIDWLGPNGEILSTETCYRGFVPLYKHLATVLAKNPGKADDVMTAYLRIPDAKDEPKVVVLAQGKLADVVAKLAKQALPPANAFAQLQIIVSQLAEFSDLKGIVITAVFEDARAVGFGFTSESTEVTDGDIQALVGACEGQIDMFKDAMRKKRNIQFEGDKGRIIIPGRPELSLVK